MELVQYKDEYKQRLFDFTDRCFEELSKNFEPEGRHYFYKDIGKSFEVFYCLTDEEKVIGTVGLKKIDDYTVELKALYLDKAYRGQHLGNRLIKVAISEAKTCGFKSIVLDSMSKYKEALCLYEKCGFKTTERFNDNVYADVFMRLEL